jgi:uncharacterized membrane protein YfhO
VKSLQTTFNINFIFFYHKATIFGLYEIQKLYFEGHSKKQTDLITNTLTSIIYKAKSRVSIQNVLCWLHVNTSALCSKLKWLTQNIMRHEEKAVLNKSAKEITQMFHKRWAFIPLNMGFDTMRSSSYLIPQLVVN